MSITVSPQRHWRKEHPAALCSPVMCAIDSVTDRLALLHGHSSTCRDCHRPPSDLEPPGCPGPGLCTRGAAGHDRPHEPEQGKDQDL
jgi:hypothetical protein